MKIDRSTSSRPRISLTPLIDMVFLLLVFFMLSTTFSRQEGISLDFFGANSEKNGETGEKEEKRTIINVTIGQKRRLTIEGNSLSPSRFRHALSNEIAKSKGKATILLLPLENSIVQDMVFAVDQIRKSGGQNILLKEKP